MDNCIECKIKKVITILRCGECDEKSKERIENKMVKNYNWPFENNSILSKQQTRNNN